MGSGDSGSQDVKFSASISSPSRELDCEFEDINGEFRIKFTPVEAGDHIIKIFKGGNEEPITEFVHNVPDDHVGDAATFTVNIEQHKTERSYSATVTSPSSRKVECTVEVTEEGSCMVRFVPKELGEHVVKIFEDDSFFPVSEFIYHVTDLNQEVGGCVPRGATSADSFRMGEKANMSINLEDGSMTTFRAVVTSPSNETIPCEFEELGEGKCKIRFVPKTMGEYVIRIMKIGSDKVISEFTFTAEKDHLGETASFTVTIQERKRTFTATVTSPAGVQIDCSLEEDDDDNVIIRFVPKEVGYYLIKLFQDDSYYPVSEFTYKVVDRNASLPTGSKQQVFRVGETIRLTFNCEGRQVMTGSKLFSATVTAPSNLNVPCSFQELDDGNCKIRFIPVELGEYVVKIFKSGNDKPISQFTFDCEKEHLNESASFTITIQERPQEVRKFSATVTSPTNKPIPCSVEETDTGSCIVRFTPAEIGNYVIHIYENNEQIPVAQIIYKIVDHKYDLSRRKSTEHVYRVGEPVKFSVNVGEEKRKFSATVTSPSQAQIDNQVEETDDDKCIVRFTPKESGDYIIRIFQGNNPIPVSQFIYKVEEGSGAKKRAPDSNNVGEAAQFAVNVGDAKVRRYSATVTAPSGNQINCRVDEDENEEGNCRVRFIPREVGDYIVRLFQNDMQISQFTYKVSELTKREPANTLSYGSNFKDDLEGKFVYIQDKIFKIGEKVSFYVNIEKQKKAFSAKVMSPLHRPVECKLVETGPSEFVIRFAPQVLGDHVVRIYMDASSEPVYQFIYKVRGFIGKEVEFKVTSFDSGDGKLAYKIMCPPRSKINYHGEDDGGLYEIKVRFQAPGGSVSNLSEQKETAIVGKGANRCTAEGTGLRFARVGEVATFNVNTKDALRGSLMVGVEGPKQPAKEITVKHVGDEIFSVNYVLDMKGNYSLYVMWSGEHIPGSPFHVTV